MDDLLSNIKVKMLTEAQNENLSDNLPENIRKLLSAIDEELRIVRDSVLESIDVSSISYVKSKKELDSLQTEAAALRKTIGSIEAKVGEDLRSSGGAAEAEEISSIKRELETLKKASAFFETIAQLHSIFAEFDNYLVEYEFDLAADALSNAGQKLSEINLDDCDIGQAGPDKAAANKAPQSLEEEKDLFEEVKIEYLHRRGRLVSIVELLFRYIFHFERNEVRIRMSFPRSVLMEVTDLDFGLASGEPISADDGDEVRVSLQDVWYSLISVGVANEHIAYLSKLCIDHILEPLVSKSTKLSAENNCAYRLLPLESRSHNECKWEYKVVTSRTEGEAGDDRLSVYEYAVPVLVSLLKFLSDDCFTSNIQVISLFGKYTWGWISSRLLHGVTLTPSTKDCQILREFEVQARSLQIIPTGEDTISNYVSQLETSRYEERKIHSLSFAREIIMRDDPSIVLVDDSTEIGSLTNLLKQCGVQKTKADKNSDLTSLINLIGEGDLIGDMELGSFSSIQHENESFLQLQICGVSSCAHSLIQKIHQILDEALLDAQKHSLSSAKQGYFLVRELVMLFILLRPTIHKERLDKDPLFTATFYTDCTYLIHHLILIPFTYGSKFPPPIPQIGSFVDLLLTLRKLQETAISSLLTRESSSIRELIAGKALTMESMKNMSVDQTFIEAETIIVDIVQQLKRVSSMFSSTLPLSIYLQSFGVLVDETIHATLSQVLKLATSEDVQDVSPDDASALVLLLNNLASQVQRLFECHIFRVNSKDGSTSSFGVHNSRLIYNDPPSLVGFLKYWGSFTVLRDTLDADIANVVQQKHKLKTHFQHNEIKGILNLNPFLSSNVDEVYYIIISAK
ncbi:centromere/kinetochore protein [Cryptosporidium canis]|uniref:Centromere/kinetochore protein n=1 Tax=Cryptosporidium canis TaxID=195482 RepID=A0ABQ8P3H8_9CRYT|nr:centromere/kinetochore protein [Cryptosporidium canis]